MTRRPEETQRAGRSLNTARKWKGVEKVGGEGRLPCTPRVMVSQVCNLEMVMRVLQQLGELG